jgi:ABC-2 type transport system ATP-binding protein
MPQGVSAQEGDSKAGEEHPLLTRSLVKRYRRGSTALDGITTGIPTASITGLIGPNGAGKSTLLKIWSGFERASSGEARVIGLDPWQHRSRTVSHVGYVAQRRNLYRDLSVADHLSMARLLRPTFEIGVAEEWLTDLGIPLDRRASTLSGGQTSQTALAIAFGTRAPILILDEPVADLDPLAREDYLGALRLENSRRGTTIVLSSHIVSDIAKICDRLVVLSAGRVLLDESVLSVLARHVVLANREVGDEALRPIGSVDREDGEKLQLYASGAPRDAEHRATLEEIVLAYLRAGRHRSTS